MSEPKQYTETGLKRMTEAKLIMLTREYGGDFQPGDDFDKDAAVQFVLKAQAKNSPEAKAEASIPEPEPKAEERKPGRYRILIMSSEQDDGKAPVPVGVQGRVTSIPRDKEVVVSAAVYEVLKNAIQTDNNLDKKTMELHSTSRMRHPVQVLDRIYD